MTPKIEKWRLVDFARIPKLAWKSINVLLTRLIGLHISNITCAGPISALSHTLWYVDAIGPW